MPKLDHLKELIIKEEIKSNYLDTDDFYFKFNFLYINWLFINIRDFYNLL